MRHITKILVFLFVPLFIGCEPKVQLYNHENRDNQEFPEIPEIEQRDVEKVFFVAEELKQTSSLTKLSFDIYNNEVLKQYNDKSVIYSPIGHHLTLGMMLNSTVNTNPIFNGLTVEENNALCKKILNRLAYVEEDVQVSIYNCYIFNTELNQPNILASVCSEYFYADTFEESFKNQTRVNNLLLSWINKRSNEIQLESLPFDVEPYFIELYSNVTNFQGSWTFPFSEKLTKKQDFTSFNKETHEVEMMQDEGTKLYFEGEGIRAVELPYGAKNYSMTVIVTDDGELSYEDWLLVKKGLKDEFLNLFLPKFTIETPKITFNTPIPNSRLLQIAKIEVDEKGTKATAITTGWVSSNIDNNPLPKPKDFIVDKTFHYIIREKETDVILFMGRYY